MRILISFLLLSVMILPGCGADTSKYENMVSKGSAMIKVYDYQTGEFKETPLVQRSEDEWRELLSQEQFRVMRQHGTEPPFTGELLNNKQQGVYTCPGCQLALFSSEHKFDSGTGWPSYTQPIAKENMGYKEDRSLFMTRTEVHCPRCKAHLGHVFDDGPAPTYKRYCINSVSLNFVEQKDQ